MTKINACKFIQLWEGASRNVLNLIERNIEQLDALLEFHWDL